MRLFVREQPLQFGHQYGCPNLVHVWRLFRDRGPARARDEKPKTADVRRTQVPLVSERLDGPRREHVQCARSLQMLAGILLLSVC